uniref:SEA domain-containing protein n=1 Tax=Heligmosomoides polygyrus TaxID=6339 RepID=A0A183GHK9_HELPZ
LFSAFGSNLTRCETCANVTVKPPTTRLPTRVIPTFPAASTTVTELIPPYVATIRPSSGAILQTTLSATSTSTTTEAPLSTVRITPEQAVQTTAATATAVPFTSQLPTLNISDASTIGTPSTEPTTSTASSTSAVGMGSTSDQFVIGQFSVSSEEPIAVTRPGISAVPGEGTALETPSTAPNVSVPQGPFTTPSIISSTPRNGTEELYPTPSSLPLTSAGGGGGSWNTETLFPTPPPHVVPERVPPSVLILKMKVPSNIDLETFDLRGNLTAALSNIVRESVRRVKRMKRSLPEDHNGQLVKVHRIEPHNNAMNVLFSVNETEVDSYIVEKDLYSLDLNYLRHFISFPVLSTISKADMNTVLNFVAIGLLALTLSVTFICVVFRTVLKDIAKSAAFQFLSARIPRAVRKRIRKPPFPVVVDHRTLFLKDAASKL